MSFDSNAYKRIFTHRLLLRPLNEGDGSFLYALRTDDQVNLHLDRPVPVSVDEMADFVTKKNEGMRSGQWLYWAIENKSSLEMMGTICLWNHDVAAHSAEIGYELHPEYQGRGYMSEALAVLMEMAKLMRLKMLNAFTSQDNLPSRRLLEKIGFNFKGELEEQNSDGNSVILTEYCYSLNS